MQIRATLKNPDHRLLPGMYATVDIDTGAPESYITLPQTAITYNPYGDTVFLVENKGKAPTAPHCRPADLRHRRADARRPGRRAQRRQGRRHVVTAGQIKLHNGSVVDQQHVQPTSDAAPVPLDQ